jgi:hypothetical protein
LSDQDKPLLFSLLAIAASLLLCWAFPLNENASAQPTHTSGVLVWLGDANHVLLLATIALAVFGGTQVEITRRSFKRQLRAYIQIVHASVTDAAALQMPGGATNPLIGGMVTSYVEIKNTGQTPAHKVVHWGEIAVIPQTDENTLAVPAALLDVTTSTIGAGNTTTKTRYLNRQLTLDEVYGVIVGTHAIYVYGKIIYHDIFKRKRVTTYRLGWTRSYPPGPGTTLSFALQGNDAN